MIVKKVPTSKRAPARSKALNVRALVDYIAGLRAGGTGEKVEHRDAANLLNIDHEGQVQEMIDLAEMARHCPQPVQHWIMSWREGEQPTSAQADAAVAIFLDEMGLARHQAIYALHRDTHNWHLHLAVNRVDPETEKVVTVNGRFDHEVAHRAIARIEREQSWRREDRALFIVGPGGDLERVRPRGHEGEVSNGARDFEERVGARSAERIALEDVAPILRGARSWSEMHKELCQHGIRFERKGSGAILWIGEQPVKASRAGRDCSMAALERRLGEFTPAAHQRSMEPPRPRAPQPVEPGSRTWQQYIEERARHERERVASRDGLAARQREASRRLAERHRQDRAEVFSRSWKGQRDLLSATRSVLAAEQAQEKAALRDRQKLEQAALRREEWSFRPFKSWLAERRPELAQEWRYRDRRPPTIEGPEFEQPSPRDIRAFEAIVDGPQVQYRLKGMCSGPAFTDRGRIIDVQDMRRESVLAALQLSAQKWGTFEVHGSESFRRRSAELAAEHGFNITNPELQQTIAAERERLRMRVERYPTQNWGALSLADAYRVHSAEVARLARHGSDPSRLDAEVAVRLRLIGYPRVAIARAIREGAPALRPSDQRDWTEYARRAVEFAFGVPGRELALSFAAECRRSLELEGRQLQHEPRTRRRGHGLGGDS
jgi:hypothetical protein